MKYLGKSNLCGLKYIKVMCGCTTIHFLKETIFSFFVAKYLSKVLLVHHPINHSVTIVPSALIYKSIAPSKHDNCDSPK